ncbi:MAG: helix-turn-helix domain-containing protein [Aquisalimonadaceae bacterium]
MPTETTQLKSLSRALDVLELIERSEGPMSLTEIATELHEATPIAYRVLQTLEARGYVYRRPADKRYLHTGRSTGTGAISRAVDLLRAIAEASPRGSNLPELAHHTGLDEPIVEELLAPMAEKRIVESALGDDRWRLSYSLLEIAKPLLRGDSLTAVIRPVMESLHRATGETVSLFHISGAMQVVTAVIPSSHPVRYVLDVGTSFPLYLGAGGKAALAAMTDEELERFLSDVSMEQITRFRPDKDALVADLQRIRKAGYAVSTGERVEGASAVTVAVRDAAGVPRAVLGLMMPSFRADADRLAALGQLLLTELENLHVPVSETGITTRA